MISIFELQGYHYYIYCNTTENISIQDTNILLTYYKLFIMKLHKLQQKWQI